MYCSHVYHFIAVPWLKYGLNPARFFCFISSSYLPYYSLHSTWLIPSTGFFFNVIIKAPLFFHTPETLIGSHLTLIFIIFSNQLTHLIDDKFTPRKDVTPMEQLSWQQRSFCLHWHKWIINKPWAEEVDGIGHSFLTGCTVNHWTPPSVPLVRGPPWRTKQGTKWSSNGKGNQGKLSSHCWRWQWKITVGSNFFFLSSTNNVTPTLYCS